MVWKKRRFTRKAFTADFARYSQNDARERDRVGADVEVADLDTKNGTHFQGARIRELPVKNDVTLVLGKQIALRIRILDESRPEVDEGSERMANKIDQLEAEGLDRAPCPGVEGRDGDPEGRGRERKRLADCIAVLERRGYNVVINVPTECASASTTPAISWKPVPTTC